MPRLLLGVSGGIAAYKALEVVRLATAAGHAVRVIQTPASRRFVGPASFAALSGAPVLSGTFERDQEDVGGGGQGEVTGGVVTGQRVAGIGPAQRIALEGAAEHRGAAQRRE